MCAHDTLGAVGGGRRGPLTRGSCCGEGLGSDRCAAGGAAPGAGGAAGAELHELVEAALVGPAGCGPAGEEAEGKEARRPAGAPGPPPDGPAAGAGGGSRARAAGVRALWALSRRCGGRPAGAGASGGGASAGPRRGDGAPDGMPALSEVLEADASAVAGRGGRQALRAAAERADGTAGRALPDEPPVGGGPLGPPAGRAGAIAGEHGGMYARDERRAGGGLPGGAFGGEVEPVGRCGRDALEAVWEEDVAVGGGVAAGNGVPPRPQPGGGGVEDVPGRLQGDRQQRPLVCIPDLRSPAALLGSSAEEFPEAGASRWEGGGVRSSGGEGVRPGIRAMAKVPGREPGPG